jgi:AAA domain
VIILAAEDGAGDTLVPRLMAAGADLSNVRIVPAVYQNDDSSLMILTLPDHIKAVEATISSSNARLAIIDPLNSFLSPKIDSHRDQDVRRVLAALGAMAERTNCAILMIRHLNKQADVGKAMYRGNGSIGLLAACRAGFLVASEDGNEDLRLLACVKSNLAKKPPTLKFAIRSVRPNCANKNVDEVPVIEWLGTSELKADELLAETGGQVKAAKEFLLGFLADGPKGSSEVEESAKASDIALSTLKRARKILRAEKRIRSTKDGPGGLG